jgi:hypothetical protein
MLRHRRNSLRKLSGRDSFANDARETLLALKERLGHRSVLLLCSKSNAKMRRRVSSLGRKG